MTMQVGAMMDILEPACTFETPRQRSRKKAVPLWPALVTLLYVSGTWTLSSFYGCQAHGEPEMVEVVIETWNDGPALCETVASVNASAYRKSGVSEDEFRDAVLAVYNEVWMLGFGEGLAETFDVPKEPFRREIDKRLELVRQGYSEGMLSLLDTGIHIQRRRTEGGKTTVAGFPVITSHGTVGWPKDQPMSEGPDKGRERKR